ncbi:nitrilase-related carbon-nitrogen hydrolase [Desulfospira joergensenii]|uniref:nitrilase-related carbon-nitrogen hydrolase n=1 Tax=Desulfospira joergensenii TaxID=53329 RepID=UPI0003B67C63|nr:nitrilase-related carbon-nitrogen hydrolase [Desulfospira joergensenii]
MNPKKEFKAAVVQFDIVNGQIEANMGKALEILGGLSKVSLAVLPELFASGFDNEHIKEHARHTPKILDRLSAVALEKNMALAGSLPEDHEGKIFNTLYFIDRDGKVKGAYRKLHLFPLTLEHEYYGAGDQVMIVDTTIGRVGLMICYDLRFPEQARKIFLEDAQMILVSAQWPAPRIAQWEILARARAVENQLFMVCSNRTGTDRELNFSGNSLIVDPMGKVLARAEESRSSMTAVINMEEADRAGRLIPCREDRRGDIYG